METRFTSFDKVNYIKIYIHDGSPPAPSSEAHIGLFGGKKKVSEQEFRRPHHNHLTSINAEIDHRVDGNVLVARELTNALLTKICWGILTP